MELVQLLMSNLNACLPASNTFKFSISTHVDFDFWIRVG